MKVPCESIAEEVSFEWSHRRISSTDSKGRTVLRESDLYFGTKRVNIPQTLYCVQLMMGLFCWCVSPRYMQLVSVVPTDPSVLSKLGELYDSEQDKSQAFQYHFEVIS